MFPTYSGKDLRPQNLSLSRIGESPGNHEPTAMFSEHFYLPTGLLKYPVKAMDSSMLMIGRTENRNFSNIFFTQSTDDLNQYYEKGLGCSFEVPTTRKQTEAVGGTNWSTYRSSDLDDLSQTQTYPKSSLGCSYGNNYLIDDTWNPDIPPSPVWTSAEQSVRDGSKWHNLCSTDSGAVERSFQNTSGQPSNPRHLIDLPPPQSANVACASKRWTDPLDFHAADDLWYSLTAARDEVLLLPTSRLLHDFKSSLTMSTLKDDGDPQTHTSIKGLLDLIDDSRAAFGSESLRSYFLRLCLDEQGSIFVGMKVETARGNEKGRLFREIEPHIVQLMEDIYGHIVIQKLLDYSTMRQKTRLVQSFKGRMVRLSLHTYASRVIRKAMSYLLVKQQAELVEELETEILDVLCDQEGNRVVQEIIEFVPNAHREFIVKSLLGRVATTATHPYGRYVVQKLLDFGSDAEKALILAEL